LSSKKFDHRTRFDNFQKVVKSALDLTTFEKLSNLALC